MAGFASVSEDIRTVLNAAWAANATGVSLYWSNDPRATTQPQADSEYAVASILESRSAFLPEIGSRRADIRGLVVVQVFTESAQGDKRNRELCDVVRNALQGVVAGAARFQASDRYPVGIDVNDRHYQANVTTRFRFDSTPS